MGTLNDSLCDLFSVHYIGNGFSIDDRLLTGSFSFCSVRGWSLELRRAVAGARRLMRSQYQTQITVRICHYSFWLLALQLRVDENRPYHWRMPETPARLLGVTCRMHSRDTAGSVRLVEGRNGPALHRVYIRREQSLDVVKR